MFIQINTDNRVDGHERLVARLEEVARAKLERFGERITRVEIHVSDLNGPTESPDLIRAQVELRPAGRRPLSASDTAGDAEAAVAGAVGKAATAFDRQIGRTTTRKGH
jgi:hypothetical protein